MTTVVIVCNTYNENDGDDNYYDDCNNDVMLKLSLVNEITPLRTLPLLKPVNSF